MKRPEKHRRGNGSGFALPAASVPVFFDGGERLLIVFGVFHAARGVESGFDLPGLGLRDRDIPVGPGAVERLADAACGIECGGEISRIRLARGDFLQGPGAPGRIADFAGALNGGGEVSRPGQGHDASPRFFRQTFFVAELLDRLHDGVQRMGGDFGGTAPKGGEVPERLGLIVGVVDAAYRLDGLADVPRSRLGDRNLPQGGGVEKSAADASRGLDGGVDIPCLRLFAGEFAQVNGVVGDFAQEPGVFGFRRELALVKRLLPDFLAFRQECRRSNLPGFT